jgi:hypothetical protein
MKTYQVTGLTTEEAELLDIALSLAVKHAPSGSIKYRELQKKIETQFEQQE